MRVIAHRPWPPASPTKEQVVLDRRTLLATAASGIAGWVFLSGCDAGADGDGATGDSAVATGDGGICTLTDEQEEGPFYVDEGLLRSDVTDGETGVPMQLALTVVKTISCAPLAGVAVEIWSASHGGKYSDKSQEGTVGKKYLRGVQLTDADGQVQFKTIYPGWYSGRACHIHLKVRQGGTATATAYSTSGSQVVHGGQMFFPPATNDSLRSVYRDNGNLFVNNAADRVYGHGGASSLLALNGSLAAGFTASMTVGIKSATT